MESRSTFRCHLVLPILGSKVGGVVEIVAGSGVCERRGGQEEEREKSAWWVRTVRKGGESCVCEVEKEGELWEVLCV